MLTRVRAGHRLRGGGPQQEGPPHRAKERERVPEPPGEGAVLPAGVQRCKPVVWRREQCTECSVRWQQPHAPHGQSLLPFQAPRAVLHVVTEALALDVWLLGGGRQRGSYLCRVPLPPCTPR